jgi:hypothetical protein
LLDRLPGGWSLGVRNECKLHRRQHYTVECMAPRAFRVLHHALNVGVDGTPMSSAHSHHTTDCLQVSAFYPTVAFWNEGLMSATEPWSGHYVVPPTVWVTAHTTQFTKAGISRYLQSGMARRAQLLLHPLRLLLGPL